MDREELTEGQNGHGQGERGTGLEHAETAMLAWHGRQLLSLTYVAST